MLSEVKPEVAVCNANPVQLARIACAEQRRLPADQTG